MKVSKNVFERACFFRKINDYLINFPLDDVIVFLNLIQIFKYLVIQICCIIECFLYLPHIDSLGSVPGYATTKQD